MKGTFVLDRLDSMEKRFQEVDLLLRYAKTNQKNAKYASFCRAAHIILIAHFEGVVKDICKDVIDDINFNLNFTQIPNKIFSTYSEYFLIKDKDEVVKQKAFYAMQVKLKDAFSSSKANLKVNPFLFSNDKNLAPAIIETILGRFGVEKFFWSLKNSNLDVVFTDSKTETIKLKESLEKHVRSNVKKYPYTVNRKVYKPDLKILETKSSPTLWEAFIDDILKERHSIVHGQYMHNPYDHVTLSTAKTKIEIIIYVFLINICSVSNPNIL